MIIETKGYRGRKTWYVSLDHMDPVEVRAPTDAVALIRAAIYYGLDWTKVDTRERLRVWPGGGIK